MYISELIIENFRIFGSGGAKLTLPLRPGLTALVGENDTSKTAVVDALRLALGTRDQEFMRVREEDFHCPLGSVERESEIHVRCQFRGLTKRDAGAFAEYLTFVERDHTRDPVLYVNFTARKISGATGNRRFISTEVRSGEAADGPTLAPEARDLLHATYLRPLRDAERSMAAGRGSRLSQILQYTKEIREIGEDYDPAAESTDVDRLSVLGVGDYASALLKSREGIEEARKRLNEDYLGQLSFRGNDLTADIDVKVNGDRETRLRQLLEKLELELRDTGGYGTISNGGLGSNNVLFMACELLLLGAEEERLPLLLLEEPEAHLHPQRQLRLIQLLQSQALNEKEVGHQTQILITTHSPNLASAIKLNSMVLMERGKAFPLHVDATRLDASDYRFLERFLDVTKANLFFARGVVIVEGDAENILLPELARLIGQDFTEHGVSIVNVGGIGLRRFGRIFQRSDSASSGHIGVPVACIADLDVMPDCAPVIVGLVEEDAELPIRRRWRIKGEFTTEQLDARRATIRERADGQNVRTFVSDEWTLEYDLAVTDLAVDVWAAAKLAGEDDKINDGRRERAAVEAEAESAFVSLSEGKPAEEIASHVYALFAPHGGASKAGAAQYLAARLSRRVEAGELTVPALINAMPPYLLDAVRYVTGPGDVAGDGGQRAEKDG